MKENQELYRYERKFLIVDYSCSEVEQFIKFHPACFSEIFQKRRVNNIYFDTLGMDNYHDNVDGQQSRKKVRIRWYGNLNGQIIAPILEYKIKHGLLGYKRSFELSNFTLDNQFEKNMLSRLINESRLPEKIRHELRSLYPALLNTYERKYFLSADKKFRITIDSHLNYYKISTVQNNFISKSADHQSTILELKYDAVLEEEANSLTNLFPFAMTKNSKYLQGMERLFL